MAIVLPDLLETHHVGAQLAEPGHDLVSTRPPPSTDQRIGVELHDAKYPVGHVNARPVMGGAPPARSGTERAPTGVREERETTRLTASATAGYMAHGSQSD